MAEKTVVCHHDDTKVGFRAECKICHQVRLYDRENPKDPPVILKRGKLNGVLTEVLPESGGKYYEGFAREPEKVAQPKETAPPPKVELAQCVPDNWNSLTKHEKTKWLEQHQEPITRDLETIGVPATIEKWHLPMSTTYTLVRNWGVKPKRGQTRKQTTPATPEVPQPTEDVTCVPDNWKEMTKAERHKWLEEHKKPIAADLETIGSLATSKKWKLPEGTLGGLARRWGLYVARPERKKQLPSTKESYAPLPLPAFPAFNKAWNDTVKVAWFEAYARICSNKERDNGENKKGS